MGRKHHSAARPRQLAEGETIPVVGGREPCPCGSGRRYKACHGRDQGETVALNPRPFAEFEGELDLIALHTFVPAATTRLTLRDASAGPATLATVLPLAVPALRRADGEVLVAAQTLNSSGDPARDLAHSLTRALAAEPGETLGYEEPPAAGPALAELVDPKAALELELRDSFDYWFEPDDTSADRAISLERANAAIEPTVRLSSVESAYWVRRSADRCHLRWVMPQDEEPLLDALARLHAADALRLGEGSKYAGSLRACGRLIVVWDLALDKQATDWEEPAASLAERLGNALVADAPLSSAERRSRSGLTNRQLTLR
ncbi:DUF5926 family protein [Actinospica robiniae]|uniref:DUF5926 family protein n=1 Tax=Actinospica robiniae TaxID=304901 RepID=UPI000550C051|nr:DUF5926 family protein [Actinospica robiniae]